MDLAEVFRPTRTLHIRRADTGEEVGIAVDLHSMDSERVRRVRAEIERETMRAGRGGLSAEAREENAMRLYLAAFKGWTWAEGLTWHGETPSCDEAFVRRVLGSPEGAWIRRQIDQALGDEAGFMKPSGTRSPASPDGASDT